MDLLAYRSPLEGDPKFGHERGEFWEFWWIRGGTLVAMPHWRDEWAEDTKQWYRARRDANLLQACLLCSASGPVVVVGLGAQRGAMVHENECPLTDQFFAQQVGQ